MKKIQRTKLFFDFDGTLVRSAPYYKNFSQTLERSAEEYFGEKGLAILNRYRERFNGAGEMTIRYYRGLGRIWYKKILSIDTSKYFKKDEQLLNFLQRLSEYDLYIYSNSPEKQILKVLKSKCIKPSIFKAIIGWKVSELMPKPNIENLKGLMSKYDVDTKNCIFIGDSRELDLHPADSMGIKTVHFKENMTFDDLTNLLINI